MDFVFKDESMQETVKLSLNQFQTLTFSDYNMNKYHLKAKHIPGLFFLLIQPVDEAFALVEMDW